jgi:hypothetical protein
LAQGALRECKAAVEQQLSRSLNIVPLVISITDALKSVNAYRRIVRALSQADIVIADVSGYDPGIMMLLGIRSVVRRGVNITTTDQEINAEVWSKIPFNLKEINPLSHRPENPLRLSQFSEAIREALTQLERSPFYQDLPVFDYVRNFGKSYHDYKPVKKEERVLFLRSFRKPYHPDIWEFVRQSFKLSLAQENIEPRLESIIDESSPRLVSQRLYEAIRLTDLCVVDFTEWRPNVFYELGVRLSVHKLGPICIINSDGGNQQLSRTQKSLQELFQPFEYRFGGPATPFRNAVNAFEEMQNSRADGYHLNNAALAYDETYRIVSRNFPSGQERFGDSIEDFLISSIDVIAGSGDDQENVDPTLLYGRENEALARKIREGVLERLCAVWLYIDGREQPNTFKPYDMLDPRKRNILRKYHQVSVSLKQKLEERMAERDRKLRELISQRLLCIRELSDLDDHISEWEMLEKERPSETNIEKFQSYIQDYIEVAQPLLGILEKLENIKSELLYDQVQAGLRKVKVWEQRAKVNKL